MSMKQANRVLSLVLGSALGLSGCAASSKSARFPTADELANLAASPAKAKWVRDGVVDVSKWELEGPLPEAAENRPRAASTAADQLLAEVVAERHGLLLATDGMQCLARELGRFRLANGATPGALLEDFMRARCGVAGGELHTAWVDTTVVGATGEAELVAQLRPSALRLLRQAAASGNQLAGVWMGQQKDKATVSIAVVARKAEIERTPLVPDADGHVRVRGELLVPAERLRAVVTSGGYGYAECTFEAKVALPHFEAVCPTQHEDLKARIEVMAFPPGRLLGETIADLIVWPQGTPLAAFERPASLELRAPAGPAAAQMLDLVNQLRQAASLPRLQLADEQSRTATQLAPHFFAALSGGEPELVADKIYLGLSAGWQVKGGLVKDGKFAASLIASSDDPVALLVEAIERPSVRSVLFAKDAAQVALGPVSSAEPKALGMLWTSYSFLDEDALEHARAQVRELIAGKRRELGLPPLPEARELKAPLESALGALKAGRSSPRRAMEQAMSYAVESLHREVRAFVLEADDLEHATIPEELLRASGAQLTFAVTYYRPAAEPWGRYVVVLLLTPLAQS